MLHLDVPSDVSLENFLYGGVRNSTFDVDKLHLISGGKDKSPKLIQAESSFHERIPFLMYWKKSPLCPGLTKYVELYPDRLVYDTMQNPEKRARMSTKQGYLQTLTTGVSALWSRRFSRFIRHILGIRFWFDENELDVFIWIYQLYLWALNLTKTEWSYYLLMVFQLNHAQHTSWASSFLTRDHWAIALYAAHLHSGWIGIVHIRSLFVHGVLCANLWLPVTEIVWFTTAYTLRQACWQQHACSSNWPSMCSCNFFLRDGRGWFKY